MVDQNESELFKGIDPESLTPELKTLYKSMQADYTRKTQAIAEEKKTIKQKETEYEKYLQELGALKKENEQWHTWYKGLEEQALEDDSKGGIVTNTNISTSGIDYTQEPEARYTKEVSKLVEQIEGLKGEISSAHVALRESNERVNKMFDYQAQLNDLTSKHPSVDKAKLLDFAVKEGFTNLEKAYKDLYHDDIIKVEIERGVREELTKRRTDGIGSTAQKVIVRAPENAPKNFTEATEQIIQQRAIAGTLS